MKNKFFRGALLLRFLLMPAVLVEQSNSPEFFRGALLLRFLLMPAVTVPTVMSFFRFGISG